MVDTILALLIISIAVNIFFGICLYQCIKNYILKNAKSKEENYEDD